MEHVKSKIRTNITERSGAFEVGFWIPKAQDNQIEKVDVDINARDEKSFPRQDATA